MAANDPTSVPKVRESFAEFFEGWQVRQESYLDKLSARINDSGNQEQESLTHLVEQVLCHYQEYFDEKTKAAEADIFVLFSPPWLSSFEKTLLWATGFRPSLTFRLVEQWAGDDLSAEQRVRIGVVREETRRKEAEIVKAMARAQESVAAPPFCGLVKRESSLVDGEVSELQDAAEGLKAAMRMVMRNADLLRQKSAGDVLEILSPIQRVKLLAGTAQFWLHSRRLGMEKDNQRKLKEKQVLLRR